MISRLNSCVIVELFPQNFFIRFFTQIIYSGMIEIAANMMVGSRDLSEKLCPVKTAIYNNQSSVTATPSGKYSQGDHR